MKYLFLLLLVPSVSFAQIDSLLYGVFPMKDGKVTYTAIVKVDSVSRNELFSRIQDIMVDMSKPLKVALMATDKDAGYLIYQGALPVELTQRTGLSRGALYNSDLYYTLRIYIKDSKVKVVLTNLSLINRDYSSASAEPAPIESWNRTDDANARQETYYYINQRTARDINDRIQTFFGDAFARLKKKKRDFDF